VNFRCRPDVQVAGGCNNSELSAGLHLSRPDIFGPQRLDDERHPRSPRDEAILRALSRLDPQLAGLYEQSLHLCEVEQPGVSYLLAHAGRELSRGVVSLLGDDSTALSAEETARVPNEARHRGVMAKALGLPPNHPSVTAWYNVHSALVNVAHYRAAPPARGGTLEAFRELQRILFARLGPFFEVHEDLEPLLAVASPTTSEVSSLLTLLLRPGHREHFFGRLAHPGWVEPLRVAGLFREAPYARQNGDRWTWSPWPEGQYLRRVALLHPAAVEAAVLDVPPECNNPIVWQSVMQVAQDLPQVSDELIRRLARVGTDGPFRGFYADSLGGLALKLAKVGHPGAFPLARALLRVEEDTE